MTEISGLADPGVFTCRAEQDGEVAELAFDGCFVSDDHIIGERGCGFYALVGNLQNERIVLGAEGVPAGDYTMIVSGTSAPPRYDVRVLPVTIGGGPLDLGEVAGEVLVDRLGRATGIVVLAVDHVTIAAAEPP